MLDRSIPWDWHSCFYSQSTCSLVYWLLLQLIWCDTSPMSVTSDIDQQFSRLSRSSLLYFYMISHVAVHHLWHYHSSSLLSLIHHVITPSWHITCSTSHSHRKLFGTTCIQADFMYFIPSYLIRMLCYIACLSSYYFYFNIASELLHFLSSEIKHK